MRRIDALLEYKFKTVDNETGKIHDVLFDEVKWLVRYLVVDIGERLSNRRVLLPLNSVENIDDNQRVINISVKFNDIEQSPDVAAELPVSQEAELRLAKFWGWTPYWSNKPLAEEIAKNVSAEASSAGRVEIEQQAEGESSLRSVAEIMGYKLHCDDCGKGKIKGIECDESDWSITNIFSSEIGSGAEEKRIPVSMVKDISWASGKVEVHYEAMQ